MCSIVIEGPSPAITHDLFAGAVGSQAVQSRAMSGVVDRQLHAAASN